MTELSILAPLVIVKAPGVPGIVAEMALVTAARRFCRESNAWHFELSTTLKGQSTLDLRPPPGSEVTEILSVKPDNGPPLTPTTQAKLDRDGNWRDRMGRPHWYQRDGLNTLRLVPGVAGELTLHSRVALMPTRDATSLDDLLLSRHETTIIHAALADLLSMQGHAWFNGATADYHEAKYLEALAEARSLAADENQIGVPRKVRYGGI